MIHCDQAFDCMTDASRRESPELAAHLDSCPRCREMAETLSPAIEFLSGPVPPWMQGEAVTRSEAPSAAATLVARQAGRRLSREGRNPFRRASAYLLFAFGGAAAAIAAMAIVPPRGAAAVDPPDVCAWKHRDLTPERDARTMTLSCVVCHLDRNR